MEQILDSIWAQLVQYVDVTYMLCIILVSYFVKKNFGELLAKITRVRWVPAYTVLVIATLLAVPFIIYSYDGWQKILLSYAMATSLYELVFEWIEKKFTGGGNGGVAEKDT